MSLDDFARRAGLSFRDRDLLERAVTHRSFLNEHVEADEDNERLEFLGDAALDLLSAAALYRRFPDDDEGKLTRVRSVLVRTDTLAEMAMEIGLGEVMRLGKGEEASGGRLRPALLCAAFEALMGALYLDAGLDAVESFVAPRFERAITAIVEAEAEFDPRSRLQIWAQAERKETPRYRTIAASGPDHAREFVVQVLVGEKALAEGRGHSKQEAAQQAAASALDELQTLHDPRGS